MCNIRDVAPADVERIYHWMLVSVPHETFIAFACLGAIHGKATDKLPWNASGDT